MTKAKPADYGSQVNHRWCPGCGDTVILQALKGAFKDLAIPHENIVVASGIGCGSKMPHYLNTYGLEGLHGRTLANATGVALANSKLTVVGISGDGDGYGIGLTHLLNSCRRNIKITYIVENNVVYGLTKGQTSPSSAKGFVSSTTPLGAIEVPVQPLALALASGATFVARAHSLDPVQLKSIIIQALKHKGFALIDVVQVCSTWGKEHFFEEWKTKVYKLDQDKKYDPTNKSAAMEKALEEDKIPLGVLYQEKVPRKTYGDNLPNEPDFPLAAQDISKTDISKILDTFK